MTQSSEEFRIHHGEGGHGGNDGRTGLAWSMLLRKNNEDVIRFPFSSVCAPCQRHIPKHTHIGSTLLCQFSWGTLGKTH